MIAALECAAVTAADLEIYRALQVNSFSPHDLSQQLKISRLELRQNPSRVAEYLADQEPPPETNRRPERLAVAEQLAAERLDSLFHLTMSLLHASARTLETRRESDTGLHKGKSVTRKQQTPDVRYLMVAAKIAVMASKLPISTLGSELVRAELMQARTSAGSAKRPVQSTDETPVQRAESAPVQTAVGPANSSGNNEEKGAVHPCSATANGTVQPTTFSTVQDTDEAGKGDDEEREYLGLKLTAEEERVYKAEWEEMCRTHTLEEIEQIVAAMEKECEAEQLVS